MGMMSWETFQAVTDGLPLSSDSIPVNFSGMGEPTLNPHLPRFIRHLSEKGISTRVTTNASTFTRNNIRELLDAGLKHVILSFNGYDAATYELMMGGLSFDRASRGIRDLALMGGGGVKLSANVSVVLQTQPHLPVIRSCLKDLGIHDVTFAKCHNRGGYLQDRSICRTPLPHGVYGRCDIFDHTLYIAWNGEVLSCCHDLEGKGVIGDLNEEELAVVLGRRSEIARTGVSFPMCEDCNDLYRFAKDPTPDGASLSEWIYMLYSQDARTEKLVETIRERETRIECQENHIRELEELVAAYERGLFMRFMRALKRVFRGSRGD